MRRSYSLASSSLGCYDRRTMSEELAKQLELLFEAARNHELSEAEKEEQRRSFAYGNAKIENPRITRGDDRSRGGGSQPRGLRRFKTVAPPRFFDFSVSLDSVSGVTIPAL